MDHPLYRVETEDTFDLILGFELRVLDGGALHLRVHTTYRDPEPAEARGGVSIRFGENVAYATIPNLDRAYQVWVEAGRYMVDAVMIPVASMRVEPILRADFNAIEETVEAADANA